MLFFVGLPEEEAHRDTISDVMMQTMVNWGVNTAFGMVGHSNLGVADAHDAIGKDKVSFNFLVSAMKELQPLQPLLMEN